ncbi:MAG TPA: TIM barrel protein [Bacillota bacterium]|nr:TIM barrel protein [Bacillota bacterium]HPM64412.1 TIM barrel protein [Bacillota bacterium]
MRLSISNIAWDKKHDAVVYEAMRDLGYEGLEIAPTRLFPEAAYEHGEDVGALAGFLRTAYGITICSMQSIWYGRQERLFGTQAERDTLYGYTKTALEFAKSAGCRNLVFGNPKNRCIGKDGDIKDAISFFRGLGELAKQYGAVIAVEPNPVIYGTDFLNTTEDTAGFVRDVGIDGIRLNLDFGTIVFEDEGLGQVAKNMDIVSHVHISEPGLAAVSRRYSHEELAELLMKSGYGGYVSIEMRRQESVKDVIDTMEYVKRIFG